MMFILRLAIAVAWRIDPHGKLIIHWLNFGIDSSGKKKLTLIRIVP